MKAKVVIDGMIVELEGSIDEIKEFLDRSTKPKTQQPIYDPNQKFGPIKPNLPPAKKGEYEDILREIHKSIKEAKDDWKKERIDNPVWPKFIPVNPYPWYDPCTCPKYGWWAIVPPPPCPVHGPWKYDYTITCSGSNTSIKVNQPTVHFIPGFSVSDKIVYNTNTAGNFDNIITSAWDVKS